MSHKEQRRRPANRPQEPREQGCEAGEPRFDKAVEILLLGMWVPSVPGKVTFALGKVPLVPGRLTFAPDEVPSIPGRLTFALGKVPSAPDRVTFALGKVPSVLDRLTFAPVPSVLAGVVPLLYMAPAEPHHVQAAR